MRPACVGSDTVNVLVVVPPPAAGWHSNCASAAVPEPRYIAIKSSPEIQKRVLKFLINSLLIKNIDNLNNFISRFRLPSGGMFWMV
jgi:hypothetical protein